MEEIAAHNNKIYLFAYRVPPQNINPRVKEVARTLSQLIPGTSEVHIGDMQKFHI
jgi:hypothetical protein